METQNRPEPPLSVELGAFPGRQPLIEIDDGGALAQAIVDTVREPLLVLDKDLGVLAASRSFYLTFKVAKTDIEMGEEEAKRFEKLFLNEASLAGKLNHPNIVGVYDAVVEGDAEKATALARQHITDFEKDFRTALGDPAFRSSVDRQRSSGI